MKAVVVISVPPWLLVGVLDMAAVSGRHGLLRIRGNPNPAPTLCANPTGARRGARGVLSWWRRRWPRAPRARRPAPGASVMSSLRYTRLRCTSTVFTVTNRACAMSLLLMSSAASCATRRSLAVNESRPVSRRLRGRAPVAASSSLPRSRSAIAPHACASSTPWRSSSLAVERSPRRRSTQPSSISAFAYSRRAGDGASTSTASRRQRSRSAPGPTRPSALSAIPIGRGAPQFRAIWSSSPASSRASSPRSSAYRAAAAPERQGRNAGL